MAAIATPSAQPAPSPWLATLTVMIGTLAAVMGASTVNTALPDLMAGLGINQDQVSWVATGYMLANVIAIPSAAWLGNLLSRRLLFGVAMVGFLVGSVLCGIAWDFNAMIAFRLVQGVAAGLVMPTAQALMLELWPPEKRGMAMGVYGMGAIMGPAIGPTVGGWMVGVLGWRSIFFLNIPFAALSLLLLNTLPRAARRPDLKFDAPGFVSMAIGLSCLQIAVSNGAKDGWDAPVIVGCFVVSAIALTYLVVRELRVPQPLLELRVFKDGTYNAATLISMVVGLGLFGSTFLIPVFMGTLLGFSAFQIGMIMLPGSLVMGLMMLVAGRLSDVADNRVLIGVGLALFAVYLYLQSLATVASPVSFHVWVQVLRGFAMGLAMSPLTAVSLAKMPPALLPQASGLFNLTRQLAGSIGIAVLNTVLTTRAVVHQSALGQGMSAQSEATRQFLAQAGQGLVARGLAPDQAPAAAFSLLGNALRQQVMVLAYADIFLILLAVTVLGLAPLLFLQPGRRAAGR